MAMMLKWIGATCVVVAAAATGFRQASRYARRPREIRQVIAAIGRLETEVGFATTPLVEALEAAAASCAGPVGELFRTAARLMDSSPHLTAAECFRRALERSWRYTAMRGAELQTLWQMAASLGVSDRHDQVRHFRMAVSRLEAEERVAEEERRKYEPMCRHLGVLGGALAAVLLL